MDRGCMAQGTWNAQSATLSSVSLAKADGDACLLKFWSCSRVALLNDNIACHRHGRKRTTCQILQSASLLPVSCNAMTRLVSVVTLPTLYHCFRKHGTRRRIRSRCDHYSLLGRPSFFFSFSGILIINVFSI